MPDKDPKPTDPNPATETGDENPEARLTVEEDVPPERSYPLWVIAVAIVAIIAILLIVF